MDGQNPKVEKAGINKKFHEKFEKDVIMFVKWKNQFTIEREES